LRHAMMGAKCQQETGRIQSVAFSHDGQRVVSGSVDTSVRVWDVVSGRDIATFIGGRGGEWLVTPPAAFFAGTRDVNKLLGIVRGLEVTSIDQVHQSLFNPDLVREALAGDPNGEVKRAAEVVSLEKVIESRPAPSVAIASPADKSRAASDLVTVAARITDRGTGVGRIEWRVNGVTAAVSKAAEKAGSDIKVNQELALDPGDNIIEVVAYNASNLLASVPARIAVTHDGPVDSRKPTLHVIAIGIDAYRSKLFSRLNFAAKDARAFGEALTHAANGLYDSVRVTHAIDDEATPAKLDAVFEKLKGEVHPRDTFIFFASAHGYSQNGRFYLIPPDYPDNLDEMVTRAISQERLQDWIANRIKARRAMLLLDLRERRPGGGAYAVAHQPVGLRGRHRPPARGHRPSCAHRGGLRQGGLGGLQGARRLYLGAARCLTPVSGAPWSNWHGGSCCSRRIAPWLSGTTGGRRTPRNPERP
jgi:hypothetical protein